MLPYTVSTSKLKLIAFKNKQTSRYFSKGNVLRKSTYEIYIVKQPHKVDENVLI